ncbi:hypothetical protein MLD38_012150 [Melastoma candidum]|uniref:Uncharacterized protein n=1 Tax=Melastoma candidum TaxID=119954 RepID=A0ACB9R5E1_9MYRT|nr:hypothetical protein MLD38_012150 [Melastoma candidum]
MKHPLLQRFLKALNCFMGAAGIATIMYSIWMAIVWHKDVESSSSLWSKTPWFIYVFMSLGVILCLITCIGHFAAESANGCFLSFHIVVMFLLMLLEIMIALDIGLNSDWKDDLPDDPTGRLEDLEDFVDENKATCKWIGLLIIIIQGLIIMLSVVLKTLRTERRINRSIIGNDLEYVSNMEKYPLIDPLPPMPYYMASPMRENPPIS